MDGNQVRGGINEVAGKVESAAGSFLGDAKTQATGTVREAAGRVQKTYGQTMDDVRDFATENPITAMVAAAGVGVLAGMILGRLSD